MGGCAVRCARTVCGWLRPLSNISPIEEPARYHELRQAFLESCHDLIARGLDETYELAKVPNPTSCTIWEARWSLHMRDQTSSSRDARSKLKGLDPRSC